MNVHTSATSYQAFACVCFAGIFVYSVMNLSPAVGFFFLFFLQGEGQPDFSTCKAPVRWSVICWTYFHSRCLQGSDIQYLTEQCQ